jgi:hypothetical protein
MGIGVVALVVRALDRPDFRPILQWLDLLLPIPENSVEIEDQNRYQGLRELLDGDLAANED